MLKYLFDSGISEKSLNVSIRLTVHKILLSSHSWVMSASTKILTPIYLCSIVADNCRKGGIFHRNILRRKISESQSLSRISLEAVHGNRTVRSG